MIFETRPLHAAKGTVLARDITLKTGVRFSAGRPIGPSEIAALTMAGLRELDVVALDLHDVVANEAAKRIAEVLVPHASDANLRISGAAGGRIDFRAVCAGVLGIDTYGVTRMNRVDEGIAIITLPQFHFVRAGDLVASLRIVPLAVRRYAISQVIEEGEDMMRLRPVIAERVTLIQTVEGGDTSQVHGEPVIRARLARMGIRLTESLVVAHREGALAEALLSASGEAVLILTARETVDRGDVAPAALKRAGGVITRFGLPVDPGARMFAGGLGAVPVLGLPKCAAEPEGNGTDWVLERLFCGVSISDDDLADLGVGGLLSGKSERD
ncbi:hypothetical protein [Celeribacter neptunius]|uniref:Molybdenum cofactor cytidylyltransferase n=1 Tax=Celeribacter neptunius TaxID=588602 RepID=A0A1I3M3B6_9RHOB|nr:hypothetical protein [Celeribacter neptunius]SFI91539.1 molybdenum cofactor cytidylyltransferase [Celeribacter neptunius]